jgi:phytoene dehydrogenase-like protein
VTPPIDVVVVGGGANGLVAAATLRRAGLEVLLLERNEVAGGQGRVVEFAPGFRAAALGLDPGWLPPSIGRDLSLEGLEPAVSERSLTVMVEPGRFLSLASDAARAGEAIRVHSASDAAKWPAFTHRLRSLASFLEVLYQTPALDIDARALSEALPMLGLGRSFRALGRENMIEFLRVLPMSVWELLDDWFECAPLKAGVATGGIRDLQQGPRSGGTGFVLLHHLVGAPAGMIWGRSPWRAGSAAFSAAAEKLARRLGVTIRSGAGVAGVRVRDDAVSGVTLEGGEEIEARAVLSTADPAQTLLDWVDPVWLDPDFLHAVGNIRHRGCTAVVLYALESLPEFPGLGSKEALGGLVSLTPTLEALERAADAAKYGTVSERPHVELFVPTVAEAGLAPEGRHVVVARAQYAPYRLRDGARWDERRRDALADSVTAAIACVAPGFESRILHRVAWSPADLEERYGLREGAVTHGELALDQILFMRPVPGWGRHATPIEGLYLGGAGTHPGPGILGGPGWLAARRLIADRRGRGYS